MKALFREVWAKLSDEHLMEDGLVRLVVLFALLWLCMD